MFSRKSRGMLRILLSLLALMLVVSGISAQSDPDPNSPTPVLLSQPDSNRALAIEEDEFGRTDLNRVTGRAFHPRRNVILFLANISLMEDEGPNAFRVHVENSEGRKYRFPVLDVQPYPENPSLYAITISLRDELGFWEQPTANGDLLVAITWRGLASNSVRLGFGRMGSQGFEKGTPTPLSSVTGKGRTAGKMQLDGPSPELVGYRWSGDRMRFLEQASFGPNPALDERIRRIGIRTWLAEQFSAPYPSANNPYPNLPLKSSDSGNTTTGCGMITDTELRRVCVRDHYGMYSVQRWFFKEALYGEPQLRHRVSWALQQIWVTSGVETQQASHMFATNQILTNNAFSNYRNIMKEMTLNPGMGNYLDMVRSTKNNPNENYAREILQLFTIGLFMLNQDGTLQLDGEGDPIPTYDQNTVNNFTKVLTGWGFCETTAVCPHRTVGAQNYKDLMLLNQNNHDVTAKTLLDYPNPVNKNIAAGLNGNVELDLALDNIFNHPNVGPFVGKIMIQHMVTSNPTPAYVGRVAAAFNNNGSGQRGDMKAVIRAILLDPEARGDIKTDPNYGKLREPVQLMTNLFRSFNVRSVDGLQQSDGVVAGQATNMAQNPFNSPTVFNYYPPDYVVPGTALPGPEFNIMTTGTAIARANFANTMVFSRINTGADAPNGTALDLSELQAAFAADTTGNRMLDLLNNKMLHGTMSAQMRAAILTSLTPINSTNTLAKAQQALYLVTTSSQYQVQR